MKKDIEWAKNQIESEVIGTTDREDPFFYVNVGLKMALDFLDQLDEPETFEQTVHLLESTLKENKRLGELLEEKHEEWLELMDEINNRETETLTPEWIDDNSVYASSDGVIDEYVHVDDLQNLIVPKQEVLSQKWIDENKSLINGRSTNPDGTEGKCYDTHYIHVLELQNLLVPKQELPAIPDYVAEWIDTNKEKYDLVQLFWEIGEGGLVNLDVDRWIEENPNTFARAWLDGYTVEEDQKYIISINITDKASKTNYETFLNKRGIFHSMKNDSFNSEEFNWSEEEIKDLENGEILFEHFATKVGELEE